MASSHSNYKHNTPTFNTKNRKIDNFKDFTDDISGEEKELKDVKRSFRHEQGEVGNIPNKTKYKWNKVTHKMDDVSKAQVQDRLDAIEKVDENRYSDIDFQQLSNFGKKQPITELSISEMDPQAIRKKINRLINQVNFLTSQLPDEIEDDVPGV